MDKTESYKNKLIVFLSGGTGNQLFQLMACENICLIHNRQPFFSDHLLGGQRKLEVLDAANILGIKKINYSYLKGIKSINEKDMCYPPLFSRFPDQEYLPKEDLILLGYFQNYRFHSKSGIKKLKKFSYNYSQLISLNKENFIAIHIRELHATKGLTPLSSIDNLSFKYYERALNIIEEEIKLANQKEIKKVIIFTDMYKDSSKSFLLDPISEFLKAKDYQVILGDKFCKNSLQVITLMSRARFVISSNSTFSWWGAYLSNGGKLCPIFSFWETNLTTPDNWIQIHDGNKQPRTWHNLNVYKNGLRIKTKPFFVKNVYFDKLKSVIKQRIYSGFLGGLLNRYDILKIKSILS